MSDILMEREGKMGNIQSIMHGKVTWYYVEKPDEQDVALLAEKFHFHPLNLDDVLSRVQRPKIDKAEDHLFIVLHFPVFHKHNRVTKPTEVDIFIGENYLVTVHKSGDLKPLAQFFKECGIDEKTCQSYMSRSSGYLLYHILDRLINYCFPILGKVMDNIDKRRPCFC